MPISRRSRRSLLLLLCLLLSPEMLLAQTQQTYPPSSSQSQPPASPSGGKPAPSMPAGASQASPRVFTVQEAVNFALSNYPAVRASLESYNAARASVSLARTSYLPRWDAMWQGDRGTRNAVLGVLLPQFPTVMPSTQGSVLKPSDRAFWVSGMGVLFTWEPFDFGYRHSMVRSSQATENRTAAQITLTQLGVASAVTDAALAVLADEQRVKASQADVDRRSVFAKSVHALVDAHLRPGADASRADAELAAARTQLIQAQETQEVARAALAEILGIAGTAVDITTGPFLQVPPQQGWTGMPATEHPAAVVEQKRIQEVQSRISVLNHAYYPHITLEELSSARGSGANTNGTAASGFNGLGADEAHNWEAGLTVSLPLLDYLSIRARKKVEMANRRREQALYAQTIQSITGQLNREQAILDGARRVAENTPVELKAARDSEAQARARFAAGVGTIVDVAEAQRLLVQAEIDDSLARLSIWRALADLAAAEGDVHPFLNLANTIPVP
jgi:outer membrane protein